MKLVALLAGILASAVAWAASFYMVDLGAAFLALWPKTNSQQFFGLLTWHALVAAPLVAGLVTVFRPLLGGLLLLAAAAAWGLAATRLPIGFDLQVLVPLLLSLAAAIAAFGAAIRGYFRRRAARRPQSPEEMAREQALRLEPSIDLHRAAEDDTPTSEPYGDAADLDEPADPEASVGTGVVVPERQEAGGPEPAKSGVPRLALANLAVTVLLVGAMAVLLYSEYRSGALVAAFAASPVPAAEDGLRGPEAPDAQPAADPAPAIAESSDAAAEPPAVVATAALAQPAAGEIGAAAGPDGGPAVRVSFMPLADAGVAETAWVDPFAYCEAVGTVDFPDRRYAGPAVVPAIAEALRVPVASSPDRVRWRCVDGAVMGCTSFEGPVCASTPSVAEMIEFCARNPGAEDLQAPNGSWRCDGTQPAIAEDEAWPVDDRGFLPAAWIAIPPPRRAGGLEG